MDAVSDEEPCPLSLLAEFPYTDVECQFYLGTTAYRAGVYEVAAAHWMQVLLSTDDSETAVETKTVARGTVAFLKYHGYGVSEDKASAVQDWLVNVKLGDIGARRQLGYVFEDPDYSEYDPVVGLAWYKSVLVHHPDRDALSETDQESYDLAVEGIEKLESELSKQQIAAAELLATELPSTK